MRRRTIRAGMIENTVREFADVFLEPGNAGPNFTWLGSFPRMAKAFVGIQLSNGLYKVHPRHQVEVHEWAEKIAAEYAMKDPEKAGACKRKHDTT